jgi:hypothetical protein
VDHLDDLLTRIDALVTGVPEPQVVGNKVHEACFVRINGTWFELSMIEVVIPLDSSHCNVLVSSGVMIPMSCSADEVLETLKSGIAAMNPF